jgi:hypothetical protein
MKQNMLNKNSVSAHQILEIEDSDHDKNAKMERINKTIYGGKLQANGYPTIFKNVGGKIEYYEGNRNAADMEKWFLGKSHGDKKTWRDYFFGGFQSGTLPSKPTPRPKPSKPSRSSKPSKPSRD